MATFAVVPSLHTNRGAKRAREARVDLELALDEPLKCVLTEIEERAGVPVAFLALGRDLAGAYVPQPLIFLSGDQPANRLRFTLAHEFGHHWMNHGKAVDRVATLRDRDDPREVEANAFAAEFLAPKAAVLRYVDEHADETISLDFVVRLAAEFGISSQAALIRLRTAGVVAAARHDKLQGEIEEGLHLMLAHHHGLTDKDDGISRAREQLPRIPPALRGSPLAAFLAGQIDIDGLARASGRSRDEAQAAVDELLVWGA
jgi:Zn-dependent peptidase ImmA (M78 family)